jgi:quinoprotein glucose dehydrogenase
VGATHQSFIVITDDIVFTAPNGAYDVLGLNTRGNALIAQNKEKQDESALYAYDAKTGDLLGEIELPLGVYGALMSYTVGDKQYVVAPVGGAGTPSELVAVQVN